MWVRHKYAMLLNTATHITHHTALLHYNTCNATMQNEMHKCNLSIIINYRFDTPPANVSITSQCLITQAHPLNLSITVCVNITDVTNSTTQGVSCLQCLTQQTTWISLLTKSVKNEMITFALLCKCIKMMGSLQCILALCYSNQRD